MLLYKSKAKVKQKEVFIMTKENMTKYEDFISGDVYESKDMGNCSNN